jgi:serine/threonine protein kinase
MKYMPGGHMYHMLQTVERVSEETAWFYTAEFTLATGFLHKCGIVHQ